jgi:hypothetical protein
VFDSCHKFFLNPLPAQYERTRSHLVFGISFNKLDANALYYEGEALSDLV